MYSAELFRLKSIFKIPFVDFLRDIQSQSMKIAQNVSFENIWFFAPKMVKVASVEFADLSREIQNKICSLRSQNC